MTTKQLTLIIAAILAVPVILIGYNEAPGLIKSVKAEMKKGQWENLRTAIHEMQDLCKRLPDGGPEYAAGMRSLSQSVREYREQNRDGIVYSDLVILTMEADDSAKDPNKENVATVAKHADQIAETYSGFKRLSE